MQRHTYFIPQTPHNGAVFIIASTFDSGDFSEYQITYHDLGKQHSGVVSHDVVTNCLKTGICTREVKPTFNEGTPFIRVPISLLVSDAKETSFKDMFNRRVAFERNFFNPKTSTDDEKKRWLKELCLSIHGEVSEVLQEIPWKYFHSYDKEYSAKAAQMEMVDVFLYVLAGFDALGMTAEDVIQLHNEKADIVEKRYEETRKQRDVQKNTY
jgi:hypothetical protein